MNKIKYRYLEYELNDNEYIERNFKDLDIDHLYEKINFYYKVYKNDKIKELTLQENFEEVIYLLHNNENKYIY